MMRSYIVLTWSPSRNAYYLYNQRKTFPEQSVDSALLNDRMSVEMMIRSRLVFLM